jgi:dephospho-CoA kinase
MVKVGLTGGIGSGKTTVSNFLLEYGIPVYNSDSQGKKLMNTNLELINDIVNIFGESVYNNGILNTNLLSSIVFQ